MHISKTQASFLAAALAAGLKAITEGTSTHGDPMDLHLNRTGHEGRKQMKAAIALVARLKADAQ